MTVNLVNQSQVPVAFGLKVPGDGEMPPVSWDMFAAAVSKPALSQYCNEFTLSPDTGVIEANSSVAVEVRILRLFSAYLNYQMLYHLKTNLSI